MTTNAELLARYRAALPSFLNPLHAEPISIDRGEGSYVWDIEGNRYLDWFGGVLTTMIGHSIPEVVAAVQEQAAKVMHTSTLYLSEPMIGFAEDVAAVSGIPDARVFFTASGSEANDMAIMLATTFRGSNEVLAMRNSYHGRSHTTQAVTAQSSWSMAAMSGLNVNFIHGGYRLRSPFRDLDDDAFTTACVEDLVQMIDMGTAGRVAAMIAEPIQGVGGFATPPDGFFGAMGKELANREILFISDEVQTGWGRTGEHFWGYQAHGIVPDILTFAKGVGNGITLAGVVARAEIMDCIKVLSFSTFGGNPLSAAAGRATLKYVLDHDLQGNAKRMGERLTAPSRARRRVDRLDRRTARTRTDAGNRDRASRWCRAGLGHDRPPPRCGERPRPPTRQGRPVRQRDPHGTDVGDHRVRTRRRHCRPRRRHRRTLNTTKN